jgi:nucleotide-binding universal stress UspA family protein
MLSIFNKSARSMSSSGAKGADLLTPWKKIILPAVAAPFSMRSVHAASRLSQQTNNHDLRLIYFIEVPRSVALQASMPVEDGMAEDALGDAVSAALTFGVTAHTEVIRVREATDGIAKYVAQQGVDLILLGARADGLRGLPLDLCRELYLKVSCEVILNYVGSES